MSVGRIKRTSVAAVALAALTALAACSSTNKSSSGSGSDSSASAAATVRIGITSATAPPTMLAVVANALGIASKHHLNLSLVTISPDVGAQALATDRFDVLAAPAIEQAILQGGKFKVIAGAAKPYFSFWGEKGSVTDWASLSGKSVGIPAGHDSAATVLFTALLQQHGVNPSSVTLKFNTAASNYQAMAAGAVQAGLSTPPYTYELASGGKFAEIDPLTNEQSGYLSTEFTASDSFISSSPTAADEFVAAMQDAEKAISTTPIQKNVLDAVNANLSASGIKPGAFDVAKFLQQLATDHTWQIIPTKKLIKGDLSLLAQIPSLNSAASKATFSDLVYEVPALRSDYDQ